MVKRSMTVYPFSTSFVAYVMPWATRLMANNGLLIRHIVAPKGYSLHGKDCGQVDHRGVTGFLAEQDFEAALADSDALLLAEGSHTASLRCDMIKKAAYAAQNGKDVYCALRLSPEEEKEIRCACEQGQVAFIYILDPDRAPPPVLHSLPSLNNELLPVTIPVVLVSEIMEGTNGVDVTLALWEYFSSNGYHPSVVMPAGTGSFLGARCIETFYTDDDDLQQRIRNLNQNIGLMEYQDKGTDLLVIQVPGNAMAFSMEACGDFGIHSYLLSQAITVDCCVLCVPYHSIHSELADELRKIYQYRFAWPLDGIHMSNGMTDMMNLQESGELEYTHLALGAVEQYIREHCSETEVPVLNTLQDPGRLCREVENKLCAYGSATAVL